MSPGLDCLLSVRPDQCLSSERHSLRRGWVLFSLYPGPYPVTGTEQPSDKRSSRRSECVWGGFTSALGVALLHALALGSSRLVREDGQPLLRKPQTPLTFLHQQCLKSLHSCTNEE